MGQMRLSLLVEIVQMNHAECDSFARFVLTPDFLKKTTKGYIFYIECDSFVQLVLDPTNTKAYMFPYSLTLGVGDNFLGDIYVQIYI